MKPAAPARTTREFKALMQTDPGEVKFIRSVEDWKRFARNSDDQDHPLLPLSKEEVQEFAETLVFNKGGLAGARVDVLQSRLSYKQYKVVLGAFGIDIVFAEDHEGYKCAAPASCQAASGWICTSNC